MKSEKVIREARDRHWAKAQEANAAGQRELAKILANSVGALDWVLEEPLENVLKECNDVQG